MNQKWKGFIVASVLLNVLLIGALLGRASFGLFESQPEFEAIEGHPHQLQHRPEHLLKHQPLMPRVFEKHADEQQNIEQNIHALRQQAHTLLTQEPINSSEYDRLMQQLHEQFALKFELMSRSIFEVASELSVEQRQQLVEELNRPPQRMPPPPPRPMHPDH